MSGEGSQNEKVASAVEERVGPAPIWRPAEMEVERSAMTRFTRFAERATGRRFATYEALHRWSVEHLREFWREFLRWSEIECEGEAEPVCKGDDVETAQFFPGLRMSYAENLLRIKPGDSSGFEAEAIALVSINESGVRVEWTRQELRDRVLRAAGTLRALGLAPGDRVAAVACNDANAVVACLATSALGAIWSSVSPDLGVDLVLTRFRQLEPKILFAHREAAHQGVRRPLTERIATLRSALPSVERVVSLDEEWATGDAAASIAEFPRFAFSHPLFVLFSSGTTGIPKAIVHGAGGTLLEHEKELRLHTDLRSGDRLLFVTTCGWMMWNWQLSALASGAAIVLYDGSVTFPEPDALWRVIEKEGVTVLGTSPAYLQYCRDAGLVPREVADLTKLRAILSTGSVLHDAQYEWVSSQAKELALQSISGGTDILGCFVLGNPNLPVWAGESQCVSLGMDVRALGQSGDAPGELVCANPFPSRPIGFLADPQGHRYHDAYFAQNSGFWTHGDLVRLTERGTARILGRSDGVLNVRGNRIGPVEIYRVLQDFPEIAEAMAVEQTAPKEPGGTRLVLLVVMKGGASLERPLVLRIKKELSQRASAAHVPSVVAAVSALPMTHNGKRSERAARDAVNGKAAVNHEALANPRVLEEIAHLAELRVA